VFTEHGNFGLGRKPGWRDSVKWGLQRRFLRRDVTRLAANSAHTAQRLSKTHGIDANTTRIIHNGVSDLGSEIVTRPENDDLRVICVGRLVPFKRVDRALEGLAHARRRRQMRLDIVGGGPMEEQWRGLAGSLGVSARVQFHGYRTDVRQLLSGADILLQPSEAEPFGLVILEGCAEGLLPIVFADGGGALEILPPDGIVVESTRELASVLDGLVDSTALADGARMQRWAWVRDRFPISATASQYLELYRSALTEATR
jgi:glycosyltransferase involved in cell wall biosynthesis